MQLQRMFRAWLQPSIVHQGMYLGKMTKSVFLPYLSLQKRYPLMLTSTGLVSTQIVFVVIVAMVTAYIITIIAKMWFLYFLYLLLLGRSEIKKLGMQ